MALEYRNVTKAFGSKGDGNLLTAIKDISFTAAEGEFVAIVGPSGCGKSTMLNMTAGLYQPTEGEVFVSGQKVTSPNSHVGFMLQKDLLLPWRTIEQNVCFGLEARGVGRAECRTRATEMLDRCHLHGFGAYYPHQLSGGMRQRAALARTLAIEPDVILLDEPFSALDAQTKIIIQRNFAATIEQEKITTLLITHDLAEAAFMADRILGTVCLLLGAAMAWASRSYAAEISYEPVGPRAFPLLLAAIFALIGAWLLVTGGRRVAKPAAAPKATLAEPLPASGAAEAATAIVPAAPANNLVAVAMCAVAVLVYGALFQPLGFVLATTLMAVPVCKAFGGTLKGGLLGGLGLGFGLFFLFDKVLDVILPTGVLSFLLGGR